jgi:hypothetical protein
VLDEAEVGGSPVEVRNDLPGHPKGDGVECPLFGAMVLVNGEAIVAAPPVRWRGLVGRMGPALDAVRYLRRRGLAIVRRCRDAASRPSTSFGEPYRFTTFGPQVILVTERVAAPAAIRRPRA